MTKTFKVPLAKSFSTKSRSDLKSPALWAPNPFGQILFKSLLFNFPISLNQTTLATLEFELKNANESDAKIINSILNETASDLRLLEADPEMNAMVRTTCVATKLKGGHAEMLCQSLPQQQ